MFIYGGIKKKENKIMHILEWNINQATNISNKNLIPGFVVDEVIKNNPDIFIFTEFAKTRNYIDVESKLDIENPIIRINTAFKGCSSLEKISVLPRIYHN